MAFSDQTSPIRFGLFDSGVGGLSVLRRLHHLAAACPSREFEFVYLGDTARCPYGNRQNSEIRDFVEQIIGFLAQEGVDHLVMACNTSAAVGLDHARQVSPVPVHDLISPTAKYVASSFRRVGVMATQSTINSHAFANKIHYHAPDAQVIELACPKLVPLVEAGELTGDHAKAVLMEYTSKLEEEEVEAIILGCTHFPFLSRALRDLLPSSIALIDPAEALIQQLISDLQLDVSLDALQEPIAEIHCSHSVRCYTTGSANTFVSTASVCLGRSDAALIPSSNVQSLPVEVLSDRNTRYTENMPTANSTVSNVVPMPSAKADSKIVAP